MSSITLSKLFFYNSQCDGHFLILEHKSYTFTECQDCERTIFKSMGHCCCIEKRYNRREKRRLRKQMRQRVRNRIRRQQKKTNIRNHISP